MRNGGRHSRPRTVMAAHLALATCFTVLACLLQPTVSEHKKKIIVKVPHLIKHIHHDVYKPVHVHKVHAKKVEHHHEEHEEKLPKWRPKKQGRKHKAHGSYSHLQPVLVHHESQEHPEHLASHRQGMKYGDGQHGQDQDYQDSHDYSQESDWSLENGSGERGRPLRDDPRERRPKYEPINMGEWFRKSKDQGKVDKWLISSEDMRELREDYGILGRSHPSQKGRKERLINSPAKPIVIGMDEDGWKPMMDFGGWKDVGELNKYHQGYSRDPINYSGEDEPESEEEYSDEQYPDNFQNKRKKLRKTKSGKWSKQIEVREPTSEEEHQGNQRPAHSYMYPSAPHHETTQTQSQSWRRPQPPPKKRPEPLPNPEVQQWPHSHAPASPSSSSTPQSHPSSVVWSGHHLETPQHTMWHVQQHNVQSSVQELVKPPEFPVHSPPLLPLRQQTQQASVPAHRTVPAWPPTQRTPGVMQKWEQSVQMGDSAGPGSAYKVEVINYSKP